MNSPAYLKSIADGVNDDIENKIRSLVDDHILPGIDDECMKAANAGKYETSIGIARFNPDIDHNGIDYTIWNTSDGTIPTILFYDYGQRIVAGVISKIYAELADLGFEINGKLGGSYEDQLVASRTIEKNNTYVMRIGWCGVNSYEDD